ncbi:Gti1/Pac2 family-domain-containing protein [Absidia repens]|uniref:Gti1/Pac2 family-domain-containing protein n=1 Tax=Absidia repens TaxID=90262 RepID=A0A1X2IXV5_9FUNG|nr:Gti1/Pac2 family-domain-containing protein [Absidia repens]
METFIGHIKTPQDALIIFEACRRGQLHRVKRRLSTKERMNIQSGSIFAFDEGEAGMRRWTDGRTWSPSRVLGSFLTYRELDTKRRPRRHSTYTSSPSSSSSSNGGDLHDGGTSCSYKPNGLIKQSFSICTVSNQKMHLISYYSKADVVNGRLTRPSMDPNLNKIVIPKGMYPELNPLDTSGGHSATLHLMIKHSTNGHQQYTIDTNTTSGNSNSSSNSSSKLHSKKEFVYVQPPSLSSSPLSTCSDEDLWSLSQTATSFLPHHQHHHHHSTTSITNGQPSPPLIESGFPPPPIHTKHAQPSCLSPPVQVWKPYSLQSEDTRQLDALKSQLRI